MPYRGLKPSDPLLVGTLQPYEGVVEKDKPAVIDIHVWCPYCKEHHRHGWLETMGPKETESRHSGHCSDGSPLVHDGYHIGLDPAMKAHNNKILAAVKARREKL